MTLKNMVGDTVWQEKEVEKINDHAGYQAANLRSVVGCKKTEPILKIV